MFAMPLLRFDLIEGRSESDVRKLLDVTHEVFLETLKVPKHDRYQVVHAPRHRDMKEAFYRLLVERLASSCGIAPQDVVVNFVTNADEDWSFGAGRAQFLTEELK
jgi:Tautomerase enzyme